MKIEKRLEELGITLPAPAQPVATYVRYVQSGNLLYISGTGPGSDQPNGKLGTDLDIDDLDRPGRDRRRTRRGGCHARD